MDHPNGRKTRINRYKLTKGVFVAQPGLCARRDETTSERKYLYLSTGEGGLV